ncbi:DUF2271 domain-containing protein [Alcanivorax sp. JB21]|uniref:DUF2271 domain-containing protein n=1 Tax=Alcanivorax limicola TaxID=2874102 RepID=UPI001CBB34FC|nr:DUF2271 domain-containing protein [Alcanivorax limicola]MBZ2189808.1 DUF2271 domain-containing protein [Alcanivorax limicola]
MHFTLLFSTYRYRFLVTSLRLLLLMAPASALATEMRVSIEVPSLNVAEYHRPYVAIWLEHPDGGPVQTLSVWYDTGMRDREGEKWLKDMRQWWRRDGRTLLMPVDGVSSATRPVGHHTLTFHAGKAPLGDLPPGDYRLMVEAAREVGGREVVTIPFTWPGSMQTERHGEHELGKVTLVITE